MLLGPFPMSASDSCNSCCNNISIMLISILCRFIQTEFHGLVKPCLVLYGRLLSSTVLTARKAVWFDMATWCVDLGYCLKVAGVLCAVSQRWVAQYPARVVTERASAGGVKTSRSVWFVKIQISELSRKVLGWGLENNIQTSEETKSRYSEYQKSNLAWTHTTTRNLFLFRRTKSKTCHLSQISISF